MFAEMLNIVSHTACCLMLPACGIINDLVSL